MVRIDYQELFWIHILFPKRMSRRPDERGFLTDGRRIQSVGVGNDTGQSKKRYGERKSERGQNRQTAINSRKHPGELLQTLSCV